MGKNSANLSAVLSIVLFVGGLFLLVLQIPFWSLFLGLPSIQIGIILIIFSFDRLSKEEIEDQLEETKMGKVA